MTRHLRFFPIVGLVLLPTLGACSKPAPPPPPPAPAPAPEPEPAIPAEETSDTAAMEGDTAAASETPATQPHH